MPSEPDVARCEWCAGGTVQDVGGAGARPILPGGRAGVEGSRRKGGLGRMRNQGQRNERHPLGFLMDMPIPTGLQ